jgi:hypothetical protein
MRTKLKIATGFNVERQREIFSEISLPKKLSEAICMDYFNRMDYAERRRWILKNKIKPLKELS